MSFKNAQEILTEYQLTHHLLWSPLILYHVLLILQLQNCLLSLHQICCKPWTVTNPSQTDSWTQRPPTDHHWLPDQPRWQVHRQQYLLLPHPPTTTQTHGPTNRKTIGQGHQLPDWKKGRHPPLPHLISWHPLSKTDAAKNRTSSFPEPRRRDSPPWTDSQPPLWNPLSL